ncbi:MAG: type II secretion system F family protein [Eubacteriales bacterium]|nr:type II secretion system F family protein [Eubacteriales bacterium]
MTALLLPAVTGAVLIYLYKSGGLSIKAMVPLLAAASMMFVCIYTENVNGGRTEIRQIRTDAADGTGQVELEAVDQAMESHRIRLKLDTGTYSREEAMQRLEAAADRLDTVVLGKNASFERVEWNLHFPVSLEAEDSEIAVQWLSEDPELISWDGTIGTGIPESGSVTGIMARLYLQDAELEYRRQLRVYPSKEPEAFAAAVQQVFEEQNAENNGQSRVLPAEVKGRSLIWYEKKEQRGSFLCMLILLTGILLVLLKKENQKKEEEKRKQELLRMYPNLVSQLQLFLAAGLSLRKAMEKLAPQHAEVERCRQEMENGMTEADAYLRFGERCGTAEYKKLALLLVQSQKKGGSRLSLLLEQEARDAFENRKRRARIEGDKTAVRMIFPMGLMLLVVLIVIMVPAMLSF